MRIKSDKIRKAMKEQNMDFVDVALKAQLSATLVAVCISKGDAEPNVANAIAKAVGLKYTEVAG